MIKFFRKIRQRLLSENKISRYLLYAIGEIALVMIGILLALQVNNWNQKRLSNNVKEEILSRLHSEFKANKKTLMEYKIAENRVIASGIVLINLIGASQEEILNHNLDSLLFETFPSNELAFADNTIKNIIQNEHLSLFKEDEDITDLFYEWNALTEIRKTRFAKLDKWNSDYLLPFLLPYISFKEMDSYANYKWTGKSKVKPNYYPLFQKIEFENLLDNCLWLHQKVVERLKETEILIDKIIIAVES